MKQRLLFLTFLFLAGAVANDVPNNSFEYDIQPVWNRMPSENIQPGKRPEYSTFLFPNQLHFPHPIRNVKSMT